MGSVGSEMAQEQFTKSILADKGGVATREGQRKIQPRQGVGREHMFQRSQVIFVGEHIGGKTLVGIVIAD